MQGGSASSGKHERRRIDGDHRRRSRTKTMAWRRCRASRGAWLGGEEEGVAAELLSSAEGRGVAGDGCYGERRRWVRRVREREREGRGRSTGERGDKARGSGRHREEAPRRRAGGGGRQTSWWRGAPAVRARRPHAWPTGARRTTAVVGWAGLLGRPAGWAAQVSFSLFFLFLFLFNITATLLN